MYKLAVEHLKTADYRTRRHLGNQGAILLMSEADIAAFLKDAIPKDPTAVALIGMASDTDDVYRSGLDAIRKRFDIDAFAPWDLPYVLHQLDTSLNTIGVRSFSFNRMETTLRDTLRGFGFADEALHLVFQEGPRARPPFLEKEGIHVVVTRQVDVEPFGTTNDTRDGRAACAITASDGLRSYRVLMHECGHAVHFRSIRSKYFSLRLAMDRWFKEAIAKIFEDIVEVEGWLVGQMGLPIPTARELRGLRALQRIVVIRQNIVVALVEMLLANVPDEESSETLWAVLAKRILYPDLKELNVGLLDHGQRMVFQQNNALDSVLSEIAACGIRTALSNAADPSTASDNWYSPAGAGKLAPILQAAGHNWKDVLESQVGYPWDANPIAQQLETAIRGLS